MGLLDLPDWILWGIIAVVFLVVEIMTTVYVALGFAIGAATVALVVYLVPDLPLVWQALIWAAMGLLAWLGLSRWDARRRATRPNINDFDSRDSLPPSDRRRRSVSDDESPR
ncbi:MAG: hypothetical protein JJU42_16560 [Rhodobacteraceae bacterium]|nr:hypothetical protein [Paracoccaceae bacterium]